MTDDADGGLDALWAQEGGLEAPRRPRIGAFVGGFLALAASAALAWWAANPARTPAPSARPPTAAAPVQPLRYASDEPDPAQVKQAYADVQRAFTRGGGPALVRISLACAQAAPADPRRLDYCLAFDIYASDIVQGAPDAADQADWFAASADRDLALARSVLPEDVDAANRLSQVRALTTAVLPKPRPAPEKARPARVRPHRHAKPVKRRAAHARKAHTAHPKPVRRRHAAPEPDRARSPAPPPAEAPPGPWDDEVPPH